MKSVVLLAATMLCAIFARAQVWEAGTTYGSSQHLGTCGRMIAMSSTGYANVVWMKQLSSDPFGARHVYCNVWAPGSSGSTC